jgi:hypothetical protein
MYVTTIFQTTRRTTFVLAAMALLSACTPATTAGLVSLRQIFSGSAADSVKLDPNFTYLRVTLGRSVGIMWRGSTEPSRAGLVEVYYSSAGDVLRLSDGRLVGALGMPVEWRRVVDAAPPWNTLLQAREPVAFVRVRDVMPGYRSDVRDNLVLVRIAAPGRSALRGVDAESLTWFEERARPAGLRLPGASFEALPPARYALDLSGAQPVVVYSEQCLTSDFCFTWQRWTAAQQLQARAR